MTNPLESFAKDFRTYLCRDWRTLTEIVDYLKPNHPFLGHMVSPKQWIYSVCLSLCQTGHMEMSMASSSEEITTLFKWKTEGDGSFTPDDLPGLLLMS